MTVYPRLVQCVNRFCLEIQILAKLRNSSGRAQEGQGNAIAEMRISFDNAFAARAARRYDRTEFLQTTRLRKIPGMRLGLCLLLVGTGLVARGMDDPTVPPTSTDINVRSEDLLAQPPAANWIFYNGDYSGRRFSSVTEFNTSNVAQLRAQWVFHAHNSSRLEVSP